jgi:hypothetical protein
MAHLRLRFGLQGGGIRIARGWRRIGDLRFLNVGKRRQNAWLAPLRSNNIFNANAANKERAADHRAMTVPRNRFGTHQDTTFCTCQVRDPLNVVGELGRLHVIRVAQKREIVPTSIGRIGPRVAQAAPSGCSNSE